MTSQKKNALQLDQQLLLQLLQSANERNQKQQQLNEFQQQTIQNLTTEIQLLNEKLNYLTRKLFGRSKETFDEETNGQLNLFEEETVSKPSIEDEEQRSIVVQGHRRIVGTKASKISQLPTVEEDHVLTIEEQACTHCGQQMKDIGRTKVREEVRFHPAILDCLVHYQHTYCCKACEKMGRSSFKKALVHKPLISNSLGSNSVVAETIRMKFGQKIPAYRQENYWQKDLGLAISRDNISNWHINRVYTNIDSWNRQGEQWLVRRANGKIHNTTKKIPAEVFEEERKHLIPIGLRHEPKIRYDKKMERSVHKDNIIHFEGNRYSVPLGTYNKIKKVYAHVSGETLKIMDPETGQLIATHTIWTGKGQLIQDRSHQRDYRKTIEKQLTEAQTQFSNTTLAQHFFIGINDAYPRYTRDHVQLIMELWASTPQARMDEALSICIERNLFSATEFRDVVNYLEKSAHKKELETNITIEVPFYRHETMERVSKIQTEARSLEAYSELFGGEQLV